MKKTIFSALLLLLLPIGACAQGDATQYVAGKDYTVISPALRPRGADKIEVVEFFAYACGHCYNFESLLQQWRQGLAEDVVLLPTPVMWNPGMEPHARAFFAAQALGVLDEVHGALFSAYHVDRNRLTSEAAIRQIFVDNGVKAKDFDKAFSSFGVGSQVRQADSLTRGARVTATPEMMVAGKYLISARRSGGHAEMLRVVDFLIERERAAASAGATKAPAATD